MLEPMLAMDSIQPLSPMATSLLRNRLLVSSRVWWINH